MDEIRSDPSVSATGDVGRGCSFEEQLRAPEKRTSLQWSAIAPRDSANF